MAKAVSELEKANLNLYLMRAAVKARRNVDAIQKRYGRILEHGLDGVEYKYRKLLEAFLRKWKVAEPGKRGLRKYRNVRPDEAVRPGEGPEAVDARRPDAADTGMEEAGEEDEAAPERPAPTARDIENRKFRNRDGQMGRDLFRQDMPFYQAPLSDETQAETDAPAFDPSQPIVLPDEGQGDGADTATADFAGTIRDLIAPWILSETPGPAYRGPLDLTYQRYQELDATVRALIKAGRGELHALKNDKAKTQDQFAAGVIANVQQLPNHVEPDGRGLIGKARKGFRSFLLGNLQMERIFAMLDGQPLLKGQEMGPMQRAFAKAREGEAKALLLEDAYRKELAPSLKAIDGMNQRIVKAHGKFFRSINGVQAPEILKRKGYATWDTNLLETVFLNMGNDGNQFALQEGYGLTATDLNRLAMIPTAKEWKAIEAVGKGLERADCGRCDYGRWGGHREAHGRGRLGMGL